MRMYDLIMKKRNAIALSKEEIDDAFDYHYHINNVDLIFKRVGIL